MVHVRVTSSSVANTSNSRSNELGHSCGPLFYIEDGGYFLAVAAHLQGSNHLLRVVYYSLGGLKNFSETIV
jgi:hypothetical protein